VAAFMALVLIFMPQGAHRRDLAAPGAKRIAASALPAEPRLDAQPVGDHGGVAQSFECSREGCRDERVVYR
jgi:hypothetical protein